MISSVAGIISINRIKILCVMIFFMSYSVFVAFYTNARYLITLLIKLLVLISVIYSLFASFIVFFLLDIPLYVPGSLAERRNFTFFNFFLLFCNLQGFLANSLRKTVITLFLFTSHFFQPL